MKAKKIRCGFEIIKDPEDARLYIQFLENTKKLSESSIGSYMKWYKFIDPACVDQEYINDFIRRKGNNTVIRGMLKNYLEFRSIKGIELPKIASRPPVRLIREVSVEKIKLIIAAAYRKSKLKGLIWSMAYQGALRRAEVAKIRFCDFQWDAWLNKTEDMCYLLIHGKGQKERVVFINSKTMMEILDLISKGDDSEELTTAKLASSTQYLFSHPSQHGKHITEKMVYDIIKSFSRKIIKTDVRPHELRFQRAKELEARGMSLLNISKFLGHSKTSTTEIYLHRDQKVRLEENKELFKT